MFNPQTLSEVLTEMFNTPVTIRAYPDRAGYELTFRDYKAMRELEIEKAMERAYEANR
jgi:hypothetical protein